MRKFLIAGIALAGLVVGALTLGVFGQKTERSEEYASYIQPAQLPDETKRILGGVGLDPGHLFEFVVNTDESYWTNVWIERYENGERQEDILNFKSGGGLPDEDELPTKEYIAYLMEMQNDEETGERKLRYTVSNIHDSGSGRTSGELSISNGGSMWSSLSEKRELEMNRPVTLITMIHDDGNGIAHSASDAIQYDETGELPNFIQRYDQVLLFRAQFEVEEVDESYYEVHPLDGEM